MEEEYELDASTIFKQDAEELSSVQDLENALNRFGYIKDDRISRRDLVLIFSQVRRDMEHEIFSLASAARYEEAKKLRNTLNNLRAEFDHQQINGAKIIRDSEVDKFQQASTELIKKLKHEHDERVENVEDMCNDQLSLHEYFQEIEKENLEKTISKLSRPNMKYSKRLIELFKAEFGLNKLNEYDEAIKVRKMIEKLRPREERRFFDRFEQSIENRRKKLEDAQRKDSQRTEEKLKVVHWKDVRAREREDKICNQRIKNHEKDMLHSHAMEAKLKSEVSVKPSALWQKRENYQTTASGLRGTQLLNHIQGKKDIHQVFADSLVDKHDFNNIPFGTLTLSGSNGKAFDD